MFGRANLHLVARTLGLSHASSKPAVSFSRKFQISGTSLTTSASPAKPNRFASKYDQNGKQNQRGSPRVKNFDLPNFQGGGNFKKNGKNANNHSFKNNGKKHQGGSQARTRVVKFNFDTGSEKAKMALKDIITKVKELSTSYKVNYVSPESNKLTQMHFVDLVNSTDFNKDGLLVIEPKTEGEFPLIRLIGVQDMIKEYSDKLAAIKEKELLDLGSYAAKRAMNQRMQAEKKKSTTKVLTLSWAISVSDLIHQKKNEIMKRINKGEKFIIFIGEKSSLYSARKSAEKEDSILKQLDTSRTKWDRMDEDELSLEMKKRELVLEKLKELLDEAECKYDVSGNLDARMMLNLTPKVQTAVKKDESELSPRELKRLKKQTSAKDKGGARSKIAEDDLDSLYLFKIED